MEHEVGQAPAPRMAVLAVSPYTLCSTPSSWPAPVPMTPLPLPSSAKGGSGGYFKRTSESSWQKALPRPGTSVPTPPKRLGRGPQFQAYPDVNELCQGLYQEVRRPFPSLPQPLVSLKMALSFVLRHSQKTPIRVLQSQGTRIRGGWGKRVHRLTPDSSFSVGPQSCSE